MRLVRFELADGARGWGRLEPDGSVAAVVGDPTLGRIHVLDRHVAPARILCPVEPRAILGIGLNYRDHAAETGQDLPTNPPLFMKNPASVQHPGGPIVIPAAADRGPEVDYEGELAVVIGRDAKDVPEERALEHVLGYTVANDVTARRWQKHGGAGQWVRAKSFDTFCPMGPVLVTRDEIPDPQALAITTRVNGEVVQSGRTADMIFPVARLVAELSRDTTLLAGTVILTGTPAGVGVARRPMVFLAPGDVVEVEIPGIGVLRNPVVGPGRGE